MLDQTIDTLSIAAVVPTCDRPEFLPRALRSIQRQTRRPNEVIVVDDGVSTERQLLENLVCQFETLPITLIGNERERGASGARNTGAAHSTAAILAFLDDDDEWLPDYLAQIITLLRERQLNAACTDFLICRDGIESPGKGAPKQLNAQLFLTNNPGLIGSNLVISNNLFRSVGGFDESLPSLNDMDMGIRLSLAADCRYGPLAQQLVCHHMHRGRRLSIPRSMAKAEGIRRFYELHSKRMDASQRIVYRERALHLWGVDERGHCVPESPETGVFGRG